MANKQFKRQIAEQLEELKTQGKVDFGREDLERLNSISSSISQIITMATQGVDYPNHAEDALEDIITLANTIIVEIEDMVPAEQLIAESNINPLVIDDYLFSKDREDY